MQYTRMYLAGQTLLVILLSSQSPLEGAPQHATLTLASTVAVFSPFPNNCYRSTLPPDGVRNHKRGICELFHSQCKCSTFEETELRKMGKYLHVLSIQMIRLFCYSPFEPNGALEPAPTVSASTKASVMMSLWILVPGKPVQCGERGPKSHNKNEKTRK